jgi:hypothetical protein
MNTEKKITIIALFIAIGGFVSEFITQFDFLPNENLYAIKSYLGATDLNFFRGGLFDYQLINGKIGINLANLIFYFVLLIGGILYSVSQRREVRMLRFSFSIILLTNAFLILWIAVIRPVILQFEQNQIIELPWMPLIFGLFMDFIWILFSIWVLKKLSLQKQLETFSEEFNDGSKTEFLVSATKNQRFFHLLVDLIICLLIFSNFIGIFLAILPNTLNERLLLWILAIIFRSVYYLFYETLLGATPAKLLSETRVVDEDGQKLKLSVGLQRTLIRFVPFEPFSFLSYGWHDKWTNTIVVKEEQTGVNSNRYLVILSITIITLTGSYYGNEAYKSNQIKQREFQFYQKEHEAKIVEIVNNLSNLTTEDIITLHTLDDYDYESVYLKVEENRKNNVLFSIIRFDPEHSTHTSIMVEEAYNSQKSILDTIEISKKMLLSAFTKDYETSYSENKNKVDLLKNGKHYEIKNIFRLYSPMIECSHTGSYGNELNVEMISKGWNAKIIEIKPIAGSVKWQNQLPIETGDVSKGYLSTFTFSGTDYKTDDFYKIQFITKDTFNRINTYTLEGSNLQLVLKKIK